jgi:hypothetical protein
MKTEESSFSRLAAVDVSPLLEKKGPFSYLSWAHAVHELRKVAPGATWEVKRWNGLPYLATDSGVYVEVAVTVDGITLAQLHPCLDAKNRPILAPTSFEINASIQRCLVKAIALHGLGLSVYAGEDVFQPDEPEPEPRQPVKPQRPVHPQRPRFKQVGSGLSVEQQEEVKRLVQQTGADMQRLLDFYGVESLADIRGTQFDRVIRSLQHRKAA